MLQLLFGRARLTTLLFLSVVISVPAQTKDNWKRVYTGEESIIEINLSSSKLEPDHILRTDFRTVLAKAENISGDQKAKYNSRCTLI